MSFDDLLTYCVRQGASDIHLHAGMPPYVRVNGRVRAMSSSVLAPAVTEGFVGQMCNERQKAAFAERNQVDLAYSVSGVGRFRVNIFRQRGSVSAVLRVIPGGQHDYSQVQLPEGLMDFLARGERGIVLVTGPTGSGKSTTLAAILDEINRTRNGVIITVEDPIEILHQNRGCVVVQRELGSDAPSFADALTAAMREDPDVIMIGEIRDYATAAAAISAAQTGHLVFSTLHTMDTIRTVNRVMELFPASERDTARVLFADSILAVISQRLLPRADGEGRVAAMEVLKGTLRIKELVRDETRTADLKDALRDGRGDGMIGFDDRLAGMFAEGLISYETGLAAATSPQEYALLARELEARQAPSPTATVVEPAPTASAERRYGR
ncbi:MAG TPA: PilT/PilU family type 4a pilus ATPase [Deinococcales bacterium]|nr:PilT/PilU family type 4a pilus ATPase [Deinococcales bacterium]